MNDTELIAELIKKNHDAYNEVIKRFTKGLLRYALSETGSLADAKDLVNTVFEALWKVIVNNSIQFEDIHKLENYLFSKMTQRCIDRARRAKIAKAYRATLFAPGSDKSDGHFNIERKMFLHKLWNELQETHPEYIKMLRLMIIHGLSQTEAAKELQIPYSTFNQRWTNFIDFIQKKYGKDYKSLFLALLLFSYSQN